ncbi:Zn-ribbon containing protein [Halosegnis sp.]|uniref:OapC/ArvC family zinc-ribbon domain-containing protein n=1 Tax=Halosegnis sp. TaxID=2864959 RepID=UPI0035D498C5
MPHQCTGCGYTFADGSKEMLGGCPDCGGNKFQFYPESTAVPEEPTDADPPDSEPNDAASTVGRAATRVRDFVAGDPTPDEPADPDPDADAPWPTAESEDGGEPDIIDADARATKAALEDAEDPAQAEARSDIAGEAEVPDTEPASSGEEATTDDANDTSDSVGTVPAPGTDDPDATDPVSDGRVVSEPDDTGAGIDELREQLNQQFESIKILEPGQYELNLMELYDRDEYIIALQENGRYVIQVPEQWMGDREES